MPLVEPPHIDVSRTMMMELSIEEWELLKAIREYVNGQVTVKLEEIVKKLEKRNEPLV